MMMMTDEDLREQRKARKYGERIEVQGRLRGRVRRLCADGGGREGLGVRWLRRRA